MAFYTIPTLLFLFFLRASWYANFWADGSFFGYTSINEYCHVKYVLQI